MMAVVFALFTVSCGQSNDSSISDSDIVSSGDVSEPEIPVDVSLSDTSIEIGVGISRSLFAEGGRQITWQSSDEAVASVSSDGTVTGIAVGECDITAQNEFDNNVQCHVTVKKTVYLTFDDGPLAYSDKILNKLKKHDVKATFFVVNTSNIALVKRMDKEGHLVALHTLNHKFDVCYRSEYSYFADLEKLADIIEGYTGKRPNVLRFPGGTSNKVAYILYTRRMVSGLDDLGYRAFDWTVSSGDSSRTPITDKQSASNVLGNCYHDVEIVLMHDKKITPSALDSIIPVLKNRGYVFETLDHYPEQSFLTPTWYEKCFGDKTIPCEAVSVDKESYQMNIGDRFTLTATMTPEKSTDYVRFVSEDPSVASVTLEGIVTGEGNGTTTIKAIASSDQQAVCSVTVEG